MHRLDTVTIPHLELWIDNISQRMQAIKRYGTSLQKGYYLFNLSKQRIELEIRLKELRSK